MTAFIVPTLSVLLLAYNLTTLTQLFTFRIFKKARVMASKPVKLQCSTQTLQFLMELRGSEAAKFIEREFNGYTGLAKSLSSSLNSGILN